MEKIFIKIKTMTPIEINLMRTQIIRMICDESNERVLNEVERILMYGNDLLKDMPCCYSPEELKQRVRRATASIRAGRGYTVEEMKSIHPRPV